MYPSQRPRFSTVVTWVIIANPPTVTSAVPMPHAARETRKTTAGEKPTGSGSIPSA